MGTVLRLGEVLGTADTALLTGTGTDTALALALLTGMAFPALLLEQVDTAVMDMVDTEPMVATVTETDTAMEDSVMVSADTIMDTEVC